MNNQTTINSPVQLAGTGLHKGQHNQLTCKPAGANQGIVFKVKQGEKWVFIPALAKHGRRSLSCTALAKEGATLYTTEHFLSAVYGLGIDNLLVELTGNELPIFDGSSRVFVEALQKAGLKTLKEPKQYLRVLSPVIIKESDRSVALYPSHQTEFKYLINFDHPKVGCQKYQITGLTPQTYTEKIADSRTFVLEKDVEYLFSRGMGKGGSLDNAIVLGKNGKTLNKEGLRYEDECVRHKILDAIGDLALAGLPILGSYQAFKSGHWLNLQLVQKLLSSPESWTIESTPVQHVNRATVGALQYVA